MILEEAIKVLKDKIDYLQERIVIAEDNSQTKKSYIEEMLKEQEAIKMVLAKIEKDKLEKTLNGFKTFWEEITNTKVDDNIIKEIIEKYNKGV